MIRLALALSMLIVTGCQGEEPKADPQEKRTSQNIRKADGGSTALTDRRLAEAERMLSEEQFSKSVEIAEEISNATDEQQFHADTILARAYRAQGKLWDAQKKLEGILANGVVSEPEVASQLVRLCSMTGQRVTAAYWLEKLNSEHGLSFEETVLWTDFDRRHPMFQQLLEQAAGEAGSDPAVLLGLAGEDVARGELESAITKVEEALKEANRFSAAHGMLGELFVDIHPERLAAWYESVPADLKQTPEVLIAVGRWAERADEMQVAARCYWEASQKIKSSFRLQHHLATVLGAAKHESASIYREAADDTFQMRQELNKVLNSKGGDAKALAQVVRTLKRSGRSSVAAIWTGIGKSRYSEVFTNLDLNVTVRRLPSLENLPSFDPNLEKIRSLSEASSTSAEQTAITFEDSTQALGINFQYQHGRPSGSRDIRMFESTGGGVAIADIDGDELPDVLLTQGLEWPDGQSQPVPSTILHDMLFRNRKTHFTECSLVSNVGLENLYGQGCSAGDINNDGFIDLYVANIGRNRLMINNGDGTFSDSETSTASAWTTSCMVADINFDAVPDLFDVNYLAGDSVLKDHCNVHRCSVLPYSGEPDMVHWGKGDLAFLSGQIDAEGRGEPGLGLVAFSEGRLAADQGEQWKSGLSIFVGNDGRPDLLLKPIAAKESETPKFTNEAVLRGVAVNGNGRATSSMGIAAADISGDGTIDLLVTNYSGEPNSLFMQNQEGFFIEKSGSVGLATESMPYVGWGTQFFDADLDGTLDLMVANGHVADFADGKATYQMPLQLFRGLSSGRFMSAGQSAGAIFQTLLMGRAIATMDWNRDGSLDCVVGAIDGGTKILTNTTVQTKRYAILKLHGVECARDAIGSVVRVRAGNIAQDVTLCGGSGYHSANERLIHLALPADAMKLEQLEVYWPSGRMDQYSEVPTNTTIHIVERIGWSTEQ